MLLKNTSLSIILFSCAITVAQQQPKSIIETLKEKEEAVADITKNPVISDPTLYADDHFSRTYYLRHRSYVEQQIFKKMRQCMEDNKMDNVEGLRECYHCHMLNMTTTLEKAMDAEEKKAQATLESHSWWELLNGATYRAMRKHESIQEGIQDGVKHAQQEICNILLDDTNLSIKE